MTSRIWLITNVDGYDSADWNELRWLPHTFMGQAQSRVFATAGSRAAAFSLLRSTINDRRGSNGREAVQLPVHVVVIDCIGFIEPEELTDLLVDGAPVGVIGVHP